jgi:hypothetical protein
MSGMRQTITAPGYIPRGTSIRVNGEGELLITGKPKRAGNCWTIPVHRIRWWHRMWWRLRPAVDYVRQWVRRYPRDVRDGLVAGFDKLLNG